jgi:hypothetical protein
MIHPAFERATNALMRVDELRLAGDVALHQGGRNEVRVDRIVPEVECGAESLGPWWRLLDRARAFGRRFIDHTPKDTSSFTAVMNW